MCYNSRSLGGVTSRPGLLGKIGINTGDGFGHGFHLPYFMLKTATAKY
jgi:hypothetical protein